MKEQETILLTLTYEPKQVRKAVSEGGQEGNTKTHSSGNKFFASFTIMQILISRSIQIFIYIIILIFINRVMST